MKKRLFTIALGVSSIPAMGGVAYAAVHSVPESPNPQMVIPASPISAGSNPATHDVGDDRRLAPAASTTAAPRDNPAGHDLRDDRKVAPVTATKVGFRRQPGHPRGGRRLERGSGHPDHREVQ